MNIHTQLNYLIEIQYNLLNVIRQEINFSSVFMKKFNSNEFENKSKMNVSDEKTSS